MPETRRPVAPEYIAALRAAKDHATAVAALVHYDLTDARQRYLLSYFCTGIELAAACIALAQTTETIGITILARSMLEAQADFRSLLADGGYVENIEAAHDHGWAKLIDEAINAGGAYLAKLGAEPVVLEERSRIAHRESHRKELGIRRLQVKERFERANLQDLYYSVYNFLCAEAHNDARALITRHVQEDSKGVLRLTIYGDDTGFGEVSLMHMRDVLVEFAEAICKAFGIVEPDLAKVNATANAVALLIAADS